MILCFECEKHADQNHHVVPKSRGGTRTIPLCSPCHRRAHHSTEWKGGANLSELIKEGMQKAKKEGKQIGRKKERNSKLIRKLKAKGFSYRKIAELSGCSHWAVWREFRNG